MKVRVLVVRIETSRAPKTFEKEWAAAVTGDDPQPVVRAARKALAEVLPKSSKGIEVYVAEKSADESDV